MSGLQEIRELERLREVADQQFLVAAAGIEGRVDRTLKFVSTSIEMLKSPGTGKVFVDKLRTQLSTTQKSLTDTQSTVASELRTLRAEEHVLDDEMREFDAKVTEWLRGARPRTAAPKRAPRKIAPDTRPAAVQELYNALDELGGRYVGWTEEEHAAFVALRQRYPGGDSRAFARRVAARFPSRTIGEIVAHVTATSEAESINAELKKQLVRWRRGRQATEAIAVEDIETRPATAPVRQDPGRLRDKERVKAWRAQREAEERRKAADKAEQEEAERRAAVERANRRLAQRAEEKALRAAAEADGREAAMEEYRQHEAEEQRAKAAKAAEFKRDAARRWARDKAAAEEKFGVRAARACEAGAREARLAELAEKVAPPPPERDAGSLYRLQPLQLARLQLIEAPSEVTAGISVFAKKQRATPSWRK